MGSNVRRSMVVRVARRRIDVWETASDSVDRSGAIRRCVYATDTHMATSHQAVICCLSLMNEVQLG